MQDRMIDNPYASPQSAERISLKSYYRPTEGILLANLILAVFETSLWCLLLAIPSPISIAGRQITIMFYLAVFALSGIWKLVYMVAAFRCISNSYVLSSQKPQVRPIFAVLSWCIPFLNLAIPYLAIKHAYDACEARRGRLLSYWWIAYIAAYGLPLLFMVTFPSKLSAAISQYWPAAEFTLQITLLIPSAILLAISSHLVLSRLAARQAQLAHQLPASSSPPTALNDPPPMRFSSWGGD